jgi:hypothetical protein
MIVCPCRLDIGLGAGHLVGEMDGGNGLFHLEE